MKNNKVDVEEKRKEEENKNAEKAPKYIVNKLDFYCPLAPTMLWHHGLYYKDCPLKASERDMSSCNGCKLKGKNVEKAFLPKKERNRFNKNEVMSDDSLREEIPMIGKTYSSDDKE